MAKNSYEYTGYSLQYLKDLIEKKSGFEIKSMRDCNQLSELLFNQGIHISGHTLARFFRVIKNKNMPSEFTLDQLCDYVGFKRWSHLNKHANKSLNGNGCSNETKDLQLVGESELSLIRFCLDGSAFKPLVNYLKANTHYFEANDFRKIQILGTVADMLDKNAKIRKPWFDYMMHEDLIGSSYFKHIIHVDALTDFYGTAIDKYFFNFIHPTHNEYHSQLTWAHAMLAMRALYLNKKRDFLSNACELFKLSPPEENNIENHTYGDEIYHYIFARYHYVHIIYLFLSEKLTISAIEQKLKLLKQQLSHLQAFYLMPILNFLFEALVFVGYQQFILLFADEFNAVISHPELIFPIEGENVKAYMAIIFYFTLATKQAGGIDLSENSKFDLEALIKAKNNQVYFVPYKTTFEVFLNNFLALMTEDKAKKEQFYNAAIAHANRMKNKFLAAQTEKIRAMNKV